MAAELLSFHPSASVHSQAPGDCCGVASRLRAHLPPLGYGVVVPFLSLIFWIWDGGGEDSAIQPEMSIPQFLTTPESIAGVEEASCRAPELTDDRKFQPTSLPGIRCILSYPLLTSFLKSVSLHSLSFCCLNLKPFPVNYNDSFSTPLLWCFLCLLLSMIVFSLTSPASIVMDKGTTPLQEVLCTPPAGLICTPEPFLWNSNEATPLLLNNSSLRTNHETHSLLHLKPWRSVINISDQIIHCFWLFVLVNVNVSLSFNSNEKMRNWFHCHNGYTDELTLYPLSSYYVNYSKEILYLEIWTMLICMLHSVMLRLKHGWVVYCKTCIWDVCYFKHTDEGGWTRPCWNMMLIRDKKMPQKNQTSLNNQKLKSGVGFQANKPAHCEIHKQRNKTDSNHNNKLLLRISLRLTPMTLFGFCLSLNTYILLAEIGKTKMLSVHLLFWKDFLQLTLCNNRIDGNGMSSVWRCYLHSLNCHESLLGFFTRNSYTRTTQETGPMYLASGIWNPFWINQQFRKLTQKWHTGNRTTIVSTKSLKEIT